MLKNMEIDAFLVLELLNRNTRKITAVLLCFVASLLDIIDDT